MSLVPQHSPQQDQADWLAPEAAPEAAFDRDRMARTPSASAHHELRPLSLGEVLDRTFALYRAHFWLFAGITAVSAAIQLVGQVISLASAGKALRAFAMSTPGTAHAPVSVHDALHTLTGAQLGNLAGSLVFFLVAALANAATTLALSEVYLHHPTSAKTAWAAALRKPLRWIGIGLWQAGSMLWIPLLTVAVSLLLIGYGTHISSTPLVITGGALAVLAVLGGFPAGFVLYLRNCLAVPASMVEGLTVRAAMRRSKFLAAGTKGRAFVVLLIAAVLFMVVGVLQTPATLLILKAPTQQHYLAEAVTLAISFLGHMLVTPVGLIGLTLLYFDQRVRKEALDIQLLLENSRLVHQGPAPPPPPPAPSEFPTLG